MSSAGKRVLVIGGTGFFGSLLVDDLLEHTDLEITTLSRRRPAQPQSDPRVMHARGDLTNGGTLTHFAAGHELLIHAAGPFERLPITPLNVAIDLGIDYIDISENRLFRQAITNRARQIEDAGIRVMSGFSVVPGMSAAMVSALEAEFDRLVAVRTLAAPDTRHHRGRAMFWTMLYGAGRAFLTLRQGELRRAWGWSESEWIEFPEPIGRVLTYLVFGMSDLDVLPALFDLETVEFKAGCEHPALNRLLSGAARARRGLGVPLEPLGPVVRAIAWLAGRIGRQGGAAMFEVSGIKGDVESTWRVALVSEEVGEAIPVAMAGIAAESWDRDDSSGAGIVDPTTWIEPIRLVDRLEARGIRVLEQEGSAGWRDLRSALKPA